MFSFGRFPALLRSMRTNSCVYLIYEQRMLIQTQEPEETVAVPPIVVSEHETDTGAITPPSPQPLSAEELKELKAGLDSHYGGIRAKAEVQLRELGVAGILPLMALERRKRKRLRMGFLTGYITLFTLLFIVHLLTHGLNLAPFLNFFTFLSVGFAASTKFHRTGVVALAKLEQKESVGELVSALDIRDNEVQKVIRPALARLLPQLRFSDGVLLSDENRRTLRLILQGKLSGSRVRFRDAKANKLLTL